MKFKYSVSPNYHNSVDTKQIMTNVTFALLFVAICSVILQYSMHGMEGALRAVLIIALAVVTCYAVDFIFYKFRKIDSKTINDNIKQNVPAITGLILALTLPLGNLDSLAMFYVTFISAIIAELFGKLIYGGFGYNIFNPAAVGRAFALLAFGKYLITPSIDGLANATPLAALQSSNTDIAAVKETFNNYSSLLFGVHQGSIGETLIIPIILAGAFLIAKRVVDWTIPVTAIIMIAILAGVNAILGGQGPELILVHVLSGGLMFGIFFMLTDPVTNPNSRQGKIIFAIVFALLTYLIRMRANLPEGVVFAILIVNMIVPMIDKYTANVTNKDIGKKVLSVFIVFAIAVVTTALFYFV